MSNAASAFIERRARNLKFFRENYPNIYMFFADYKMSRYRLNILPDTQEVDIVSDAGSFYGNQGKAFAKAEVASFRKVFSPGKLLKTVAPINSAGLYYPRFMHRRLNALVGPYQDSIQKEGYTLEFYPLVVFMGVGLGLQVEGLCRQEKLQHAIIVEPQPDIFAASLYTVDWEKVCRPFMGRVGRSIRFILGMTGEVDSIYSDLWNALIGHCPTYPVGTMFFTHRGDAGCNRIVDKLNSNMMLFLSSWGHYDDEIRQFNNALHTFNRQVPFIPEHLEGAESMPVFLVGNGPSLDSRIEVIRQLRDKVVLVSCGTALRSLLQYGIEPDFHVELESDFITFRVLDALDHETLKRLRLISVSHVCPLIFDLFGQSRIYFKKENCIAQFFGDGHPVIANGVPTCTNAALALSLYLGFEDIYLFGMDFGYHDRRYHHSKASIYQAEDKGSLSDIDFIAVDEMEVEGWRGETVYTTPIFFSTLRMTERVIGETRRKNGDSVSINACADGARIEGANWLSNEKVLARVANRDVGDRSSLLAKLFDPEAQSLPQEAVSERITFAGEILRAASRDLIAMLRGASFNSLWELSCCCSQINDYLEEQLEKKSPGSYYLIRGSVRVFIFIGLSYAWMIGRGEARKAFVRVWRTAFIEALEALPGHFERVTGKSFTQEDPWVRQAIFNEEVFAEGV